MTNEAKSATCHHMYYDLEIANRWTYEISIDEEAPAPDGLMDCIEVVCRECKEAFLYSRVAKLS